MTIKEYLQDKISKFGIFSMSDADLLDICEKTGFNADSEATDYTVKEREIAFVKFIPELLLFVDSMSEGDISFSRSDVVNKLKAYYSLKTKELGIVDLLNQRPTVTFS